MELFYNATPKEILNERNKIITGVAIPALLKQGFNKSPFSTAWFGRNEHGDFNYQLCRLENSTLEIIDIYVARGEKWVKFHLNIFELQPRPGSIQDLNDLDGIQFGIPPNSLTNMHLRCDDIKGAPLFSSRYMAGHKLNRFLTKKGLSKSAKKLSDIIENDMLHIERFRKRWYELHHPLTTTWTGHPIKG